MQSMLYRVSPVNRMVLAVVVCTLLGTALLACLVPARRASIDPMAALRQE
jgi:ABC-type lipoprotein release transport system permease subunit